MKEKFIINNMVVYHPEQHRLTPLGSRGQETALNIPASRCLLLMLQRPGVNINQEEFFCEVWEKNGQYVTANTFYQNISLIRKGIRNAGLRSNVIRTVPRVGLCFTGTVQVIDKEEDERDSALAQEKIYSDETLNSTKDISDISESEKKEEPEKVENTDEVKNTKTEFHSKKIRNLTFARRLTRININNFSLFLLICFILLTTVQSKNEQFFSTHIKIADVNQCSIYVNRDDLTENYGQYINFLNARDVVCSPSEFIYISNKSSKEDTLVLFCQYTDKENLKCSTRFRLASVGAPRT